MLAIEAAVQAAASDALSYAELARRIYGGEPTRAQLEAIGRACRQQVALGFLDGGWRRPRWGQPIRIVTRPLSAAEHRAVEAHAREEIQSEMRLLDEWVIAADSVVSVGTGSATDSSEPGARATQHLPRQTT